MEGRVTSWNPGAQDLRGYSAAEIDGEPFSRFYVRGSPRWPAPSACWKRRARQGGSKARVAGAQGRQPLLGDGTLHLMKDDSGAPIGFAKVTRDMTEQRAAQHALIESERRFRYLVEGWSTTPSTCSTSMVW
ncbi:PAS domain-containing protein [Caulobacter segnis]